MVSGVAKSLFSDQKLLLLAIKPSLVSRSQANPPPRILIPAKGDTRNGKWGCQIVFSGRKLLLLAL